MISNFSDRKLFGIIDNNEENVENVENVENEENESNTIRWKDFQPKMKCYSFWTWFYSVTVLTRDHFRDLWNSNGIIGFISKSQARDKLIKINKMNTFLLRFSENLYGEFLQLTIQENYRCGLFLILLGDNLNKTVLSISFTPKDICGEICVTHMNPKDLMHISYKSVISMLNLSHLLGSNEEVIDTSGMFNTESEQQSSCKLNALYINVRLRCSQVCFVFLWSVVYVSYRFIDAFHNEDGKKKLLLRKVLLKSCC